MKNKIQRQNRIFPLFLVIYEVILYLSNDTYLPALPTISDQFDITKGMAQLTLTLWFLGSASMQLIIGPLSETKGRKKVILFGGVIFFLATLACAYSNNIYFLLLFRFLQGASVVSMIVPGYATIHETFDQKKSIRLLALMASCTILAPSFGPLLGSILLKFIHWQTIFTILALLALIPLFGLALKMPKTAAKIKTPLAIKTILKQYTSILKNRQFMMYSLSGQCLFAAMIAWITAGPFLIIEIYQYTEFEFGFSQLFIFGLFIIGTRVLKLLMEKYQPHFIARFGFILAFSGSIYLFIASHYYASIYLNLVIGMTIIAFGTGLLYPVTQRLSIESSNEAMGSKVAINSLLTGCASVVGSFVMSKSEGSFISMANFLLVLCLTAVALKWTTRHKHVKAE